MRENKGEIFVTCYLKTETKWILYRKFSTSSKLFFWSVKYLLYVCYSSYILLDNQSGLLPSGFSTSPTCCMSCSLITLDLIITINLLYVTIWRSSTCNFLQPLLFPLFLGSLIFYSTYFSNTHNPPCMFYWMYPSRHTTVVVHKAKVRLRCL